MGGKKGKVRKEKRKEEGKGKRKKRGDKICVKVGKVRRYQVLCRMKEGRKP